MRNTRMAESAAVPRNMIWSPLISWDNDDFVKYLFYELFASLVKIREWYLWTRKIFNP